MSVEDSRVYLDFNAGAPVLTEAVAATVEALERLRGNPSSPHAEGREARRILAVARAAVAGLVGSEPGAIVFVSSGTEANVSGLWGLAAAGGRLAGRRVCLGATEHPAVVEAAGEFGRLGATLVGVPVDRSGRIRLAGLEQALAGTDEAVVAIQLANQETGVLQPIEDVVRVARACGARVHCDAVQAVGRVAVDFDDLGVDTLALAGHKLGAPPGTGALAVRAGVELAPLIPGSQESHRRGGTENVPGIAGLGAAAALARRRLSAWATVEQRRDRFEAEVAARVPGATVLGAGAPRLPNTSCLVLPAPLRGGAVVAALDLEGIAVSSGSACSAGVERRSAVAEAMGWDAETSERTLRVSLGIATSDAEVDRAVAALERVVRRGTGGSA